MADRTQRMTSLIMTSCLGLMLERKNATENFSTVPPLMRRLTSTLSFLLLESSHGTCKALGTQSNIAEKTFGETESDDLCHWYLSSDQDVGTSSNLPSCFRRAVYGRATHSRTVTGLL